MRYRLVHFDLDGTLVDSAQDLAASTNHVRRSYGMEPMEPGEILGMVGRGARVLVARALGLEGTDHLQEGIRRFLAHYEEHCLDRTRPFPGMVELIDRLRNDGIRFSVVTNKPEALARKVLGGLGLVERFVAVVGGDTFPGRKPDPAGVHHVQSQVGLGGTDALMVGDSEVDVETARNAGIRSCGVLWGFDPAHLKRSRPDVIVASVDELETVIRGKED